MIELTDLFTYLDGNINCEIYDMYGDDYPDNVLFQGRIYDAIKHFNKISTTYILCHIMEIDDTGFLYIPVEER